jgi:DNA polymerase-1
VEAFRIPVLELPGYEADDVIGTLAEQACAAELETVIVSGDKDFYQLIRPHVCLLNPGRGGPQAVDEEWVDTRNAHERLGVSPEHVTDYLGLIGDASDNVPGVQGIGPKTAVQLIEQYGGMERILEHVDEIKAKRAREALLASRDAALLSKQLVTIRRDLPVELDLEALRRKEPDRPALKELMLALEFHSLVRDWAGPAPDVAEEPRRVADYRLVQDVRELHALVDDIRAAGRVSVDTETSSTDPMRAELAGISFSLAPGEGFYLPFGHRTRSQGELEVDAPAEEVRNLPPLHSEECAPLVRMLEDPQVAKVGQNLKYDYLVFRRAGIDLRGLDFDTMIGSYLLEPGRREHGLDSLALQHLDCKTCTYEDVTGKGKAQIPFAEVELEAARDYACEDTDIALQLAERFGPELERLHLAPLFRDIEMPLIEVLADMEWAGIRIDEPFFARMNEELVGKLREVEKEIYAEAGTEFNIGSNLQLARSSSCGWGSHHQAHQDGRLHRRGRAAGARGAGAHPSHAAHEVPPAREAARHRTWRRCR